MSRLRTAKVTGTATAQTAATTPAQCAGTGRKPRRNATRQAERQSNSAIAYAPGRGSLDVARTAPATTIGRGKNAATTSIAVMPVTALAGFDETIARD